MGKVWVGPLLCGHEAAHHAKGLCKLCYTAKWAVDHPDRLRARKRAHHIANRTSRSVADKLRQRRLRREVITAYGGVCACCGEDETGFLCLDHIYNDGAAERRADAGGNRRGTNLKLYRRLRREGFPQGRYQVLCWNCNAAKAQYGICPHQATRERAA